MPEWKQVPLAYVDDSPIHGKGLFARRAIAAKTFIGVYAGRRVEENGVHVLWVEGDHEDEWIGYDGTSILRFLNHSPEPNAELDGQDLYALRDIDQDEEITIDYGEWFDEGE